MSEYSFSKVFKNEDGTPEVDCEYTEEIVCPWYGYIHGDSWEYHDDSGEIECWECGRDFKFERNIEVTYSTEKVVER